MSRFILATVLFVGIVVSEVFGHGMMLDPAGRASRWRYNKTAPVNYNDNELFCGGFNVQWNTHKGNCGICGDNYGNAVPRRHEFGGEFGEGVIVKKYNSGDEVVISSLLTANHKGEFYFDVCNMDVDRESEDCFAKNKLKLATGEDKYVLPSYTTGYYNATIKIPKDLNCKHCVLRWTYRTGNTWGWCENGTGAVGCGPQEHFRSCADVSIY